MKKFSTLYWTAYVLLVLFTFLTLIAHFVPLSLWFPGIGLDPSWVFGINQATAQHLAFGRDIIFTFGPYTPIYTHQYNPATDTLMVFTSFFLCVGFLLTFILTLKKETFLGSIFLSISIMLAAQATDALLFGYILLTALSLVALIHYVQQKRISISTGVLFTAILFSNFGLLILIKGSLFILCAPILILSIVFCCLYKRLDFAITAFLSTILSTFIFWHLVHQPLSPLLYFIHILLITSGYSAAMSSIGPFYQIVLFTASALFILLCLLTQKKLDIRAKWFVLLCYALFLFIAFKEGFVRHDAHAIYAANSLLLANACLLLFNSIKRPVIIVSLCLSVFTAFSITYYNTPSIRANLAAIKNSYLFPLQGLKGRLEHPEDLKKQYETVILNLKQQVNFPVFKGKTDIYPVDIASLLASGNTWDPRPVFQSYSAYTPQLINMNKAHLLGISAPDYIIFKVGTIDNRFPTLEDGASWPVLLSLYTPDKLENDFVYLHRKENCHFVDNMPTILEKTQKMNRWLTLPQIKNLLFAEIDIRPSFLGKIATLLYKPSQLTIMARLRDGSEKEYRIIPSMAQTGFLISPFIENTSDFAKLYQHHFENQNNKEIVAIKISDDSRKNLFWQKNYSIRIREMIPNQLTDCSGIAIQ